VPSCPSGLVVVAGIVGSYAFAVAGQAIALQGDENALPVHLPPKRSLERRHKRHAEVMEAKRLDFHIFLKEYCR
jgi:hypothetical protein